MNSTVYKKIYASATLALLCSVSLAQQANNLACGNVHSKDGFGPFDYRAEGYIPESTYGSHAALLNIVESGHFTPKVEALIRGETARSPAGDLHYTLVRFPNHHRALVAIENLGIREKVAQPVQAGYSVECYFLRAVTWRPNDRIARMLFAQFLVKAARLEEANVQLIAASELAPDNPFTQNNIGLIYFDMKDYEKSVEHAHKAMALGLGLPTLKNKLKGVNAWREPVAESEAAASHPAASEPKKY